MYSSLTRALYGSVGTKSQTCITSIFYKNFSTTTINYKMDFGAVRENITTKEFDLIDVRNLDELQSEGKIPGSVHIPRKYFFHFDIVNKKINILLYILLF